MQLIRKVEKLQFDTMFAPCLVEGESYAIRSRKLTSIFVSLMSFNGILGVPVEIATILQEYNIGSIIMIVCMTHLVISMSFIPYLYLRKTKKLSQGMLDFQMWSALPGLLSMILFGPQLSASMPTAILALTAVILRVRLWMAFLLILLVFNIFYLLRQDYASEIPQFQIFVREQFFFEKITAGFGNYFCTVFFFAIGLHKVIQEFVQRSEEADAAIQMNLAVADKLRMYDTDGVAEILAANANKVDSKLLRAFSDIQRNLQEYRAHIPDYVIAATISQNESVGDDDDEIQDEDDEDDDEGRLLHSESSNAIETADSSSKIPKAITSFSRTQSSRSISHSTKQKSISSKSDNHQQQHPPVSSSATCNNNNKQLSPKHHFAGRVTTVFVRFSRAEAGFYSTVNRSLTITFLNKCVESATQLAKVHGGALQYMQGCGLMVSFNAASRIATHDVKACAFAVGLRDAIREMSSQDLLADGATMQATIVTSNVLSFFAGNVGQLMLTVLGSYMPVHVALHGYLSSTLRGAASCVVCLDGVAQSVETRIILRPIGALTLPSGKGESIIHEVVSMHKDNNGDEWMYQLAHQEHHDPHAPIKTALSLAITGKFKEAVSVLKTTNVSLTTILDHQDEHSECLPASVEANIILNQCLLQRLEACCGSGGGEPAGSSDRQFSFSMPPVDMW